MRSAILFILLPLVNAAASASRCRCTSDQACWPKKAAFSVLQSQLTVPLLHPTPPESACYPVVNPTGNCTDVLVNTHDGNWRSDQPGSLQSPNFETFTFPNGSIEACYLNTTLGIPCGQGSISTVGVDARTVKDVMSAVVFASLYNLRLVIKNTGHDLLGRSAGRGSLLLWTHHLKDITYNPAFVPDGAPRIETYNALTFGAGVQWHEAYAAAQSRGRFIVGGLSAGASVGAAGGWIQGGGHSAFSATYGLGVDNAVQFTVVTALGLPLTVNSRKYPDLFWALRGGGGGTYAVITSVTYKTHAATPLSSAFVTAGLATTAIAKEVLTEFVTVSARLAEAGWGGYGFIQPGSLAFLYVAPNIPVSDASATINPLFQFIANKTGGLAQTSVTQIDSFTTWFEHVFSAVSPKQDGFSLETGSRLISADTATKNASAVADALLSLSGRSLWNLVAGGAVSKVSPDAAGINPAWRKALAHIIFSEVWPEGTTNAQISSMRSTLASRIDIFEALSPGGGAYFNEASLFEKNPKQTFFGSHYDKLKKIKDIYDPKALFLVAEGVGSDEWDSNLVCRR